MSAICWSIAAITPHSHHVEISADHWPDHVRLSDIEPGFVRTTRDKRGSEVRPTFLTPAWVQVSAVVTGHSRPLSRARSIRATVPPSAAREKVSDPLNIERVCAVPLPCLRRGRR